MNYQLIKSGSSVCPVNTTEKGAQDPLEQPAALRIGKQQLVNKLNFINFQDETININLKHRKYGHVFNTPAKPQPCMGEEVFCTWLDTGKIKTKLNTYEFDSIVIKDNQWDLKLCLELDSINETYIRFKIPEIYYQLISKRLRNARCTGVSAKILQNSVIFDGTLTDFCATEFNVKTELTPPQTSQWINPNAPVSILFSRDDEILYSGECNTINESTNGNSIDFTFEPTIQSIQRFKKKKFRSTREKITPTPLIHLKHPLTGQTHDFKVINLSGSGFSVEEHQDTPVLIPGLILPEVEMRFADSFKIKFKAQVVYRKKFDSSDLEAGNKCGLVLLDIASKDHLNLQSVLLQQNQTGAFICNELNIDTLWDFLFESGFIYPEKYTYIQKDSDSIKSTYSKVYSQPLDIARHFTYQSNGQIAGHLSMIRFYERTWLIHHHAGKKSASYNAGLVVLNQIGQFSNNSHNLYSNHMKYLMCYFRPENKFPNRVFGGAARTINDENKCGIEPFAYYHFDRNQIDNENNNNIPWNWSLNPSETEDFEELTAFYSSKCGGLLLKALDVDHTNIGLNSLSKEYKKTGLRRERYFFSLKRDRELIAVIMVNISDRGLNLSDLTSGTKILILDSDNLPHHVLKTAISLISIRLNTEDFPVLVHPVDYMTNNSAPFEKIYHLWMLDTQYGDTYFRYVNRLTRLAS